jgi:hypothetical protein
MTNRSITLRMPADLVKKIDAIAAEQSKRLSLRVDRSQVIRQFIIKALEGK